MRNLILSAIAGTALLGTTAIAPASAAVSADINIQVGRRAPAVYFDRQPRVVLIPETRVYYVQDLDYDMYRCGDSWYIDDGGYWYSSQSYRGPFVSISFSSLPRRILNVPISYRHQPYRSRDWNQGDYGRGQNNGSWGDGRNQGSAGRNTDGRYNQGGRGSNSGDQGWRDRGGARNGGNQQNNGNWRNQQGDQGSNLRNGNGRDQNGNGNSRGNGRGHGKGHNRNHGNG